MGAQDPSIKQNTLVSSLPQAGVHEFSTTVPANDGTNDGQSDITVNYIPAGDTLTLWNMLFSLYVDVEDDAHLYPNGSALNTNRLWSKIKMMWWIDWANSSDVSNIRAMQVQVRNADTSSHVIYLRLKGYLTASIVS